MIEAPPARAVRIVECRPGQAPREVDAVSESARGEAVHWLDVDVRTFSGRPEAETVRELSGLLEDLCPGVDDEMLADLLDADLWPKRRRYGDVRAVSAAAAAPSESTDERSRAGSLTFQLVEMLAGDGWLVTCWHAPRTFTGSEEEPGIGPLDDHSEVIGQIEQAWASERPRPRAISG